MMLLSFLIATLSAFLILQGWSRSLLGQEPNSVRKHGPDVRWSRKRNKWSLWRWNPPRRGCVRVTNCKGLSAGGLHHLEEKVPGPFSLGAQRTDFGAWVGNPALTTYLL